MEKGGQSLFKRGGSIGKEPFGKGPYMIEMEDRFVRRTIPNYRRFAVFFEFLI